MPIITRTCGECGQPATIGFTADNPIFCLYCAESYRKRSGAFELDEQIKKSIVNAAGRALGLDVPIFHAIKIKFDSEKDKDVPLGSVLVMPLLRWYHMPIWWMRAKRVRAAVREATPAERLIFVYPTLGVEHAQETKS